MEKAEAVAYLLESGFAKTDAVRAALEAEVAPRVKAKAPRTVKVRVKSAKPKAKAKVKSTDATEAEVDALYAAVYGNN